jgi:hypothetical protein
MTASLASARRARSGRSLEGFVVRVISSSEVSLFD